MSRWFDIDIMNIDIFLYCAYSKRDKVFLLIDLTYLAFWDTFIDVNSRSYFFRGFLNEIEKAITRIIAFVVVILVLPRLLNR